MPRGVKKENLPSKVCVVCNRPFTWRKKWERCWDEVLTCSDRCKNERRRGNRGSTDAEAGTAGIGAEGNFRFSTLPVSPLDRFGSESWDTTTSGARRFVHSFFEGVTSTLPAVALACSQRIPKGLVNACA